ncbi:unnamed protein product [Symbiodinium necroappetens]|uniref:Uncharacterized protein n=1 Tax=Symbiodinium necroappetens TaxID=1628268 RepID=A0A812NMZ7_9DINO|nr:unnamed protein product [Symbiodinium necroappetens]
MWPSHPRPKRENLSSRPEQARRRNGAVVLGAAIGAVALSSEVQCWIPPAQPGLTAELRQRQTPLRSAQGPAAPLGFELRTPQPLEAPTRGVVEPLPLAAKCGGLRGAAPPAAVRAMQAVHGQSNNHYQQVVDASAASQSQMSYFAPPKTTQAGQFAPGVLDRIKMRLEGQGTYAVISALVVNMGIRLLSGNSADMMSQAWCPIACLYSCALATCVLSGVYATIVFTLTKMYSMTVIGNYKDAQFSEFFQETTKYRVAGFWAFCASLGSFAFAFVTFFLLKVRGLPGIAGCVVGFGIVVKAMLDFRGIYRRAGRILS